MWDILPDQAEVKFPDPLPGHDAHFQVTGFHTDRLSWILVHDQAAFSTQEDHSMFALLEKFGVATLILATALMATIPTPCLGTTEFLIVDSVHHCCLNSALAVPIPPGTVTFTYVSGAWNNHAPTGVYLGYVRLEIPALGIVASLGTTEQVGFATYLAAEQAAMGSEVPVLNNLSTPVTAYFFVYDGCSYGGWCGDNSGQVTLSLTDDTVASDLTAWSTVKACYR